MDKHETLFSAHHLFVAYESDKTLLDETFVTHADGSGFSRSDECAVSFSLVFYLCGLQYFPKVADLITEKSDLIHIVDTTNEKHVKGNHQKSVVVGTLPTRPDTRTTHR